MEPKIQLSRNCWMTFATAFAVVIALTLPGRAGAQPTPLNLGSFAISNSSWTPITFGGFAPVQDTYTWSSGHFSDTYTFAVASSPFEFMRLDPAAGTSGTGFLGISNLTWNVFDSLNNSVYSGTNVLASNSQSLLQNPGNYHITVAGDATGPGFPCGPNGDPCWAQGAKYWGTLQLAPPLMTPVPEPETYAMMLAGLGLMGFVARRRKQKETA